MTALNIIEMLTVGQLIDYSLKMILLSKKKTLIFSLSLLLALPVMATDRDYQWYRCIVKASSHLAFYTFRISTKPCMIYWREIDTEIKISECKPPILSGLKPSAQDQYSIVWFNLETGAFYDYLSGVKDRGVCTASKEEPAPFSSDR